MMELPFITPYLYSMLFLTFLKLGGQGAGAFARRNRGAIGWEGRKNAYGRYLIGGQGRREAAGDFSSLGRLGAG